MNSPTKKEDEIDIKQEATLEIKIPRSNDWNVHLIQKALEKDGVIVNVRSVFLPIRIPKDLVKPENVKKKSDVVVDREGKESDSYVNNQSNSVSSPTKKDIIHNGSKKRALENLRNRVNSLLGTIDEMGECINELKEGLR